MRQHVHMRILDRRVQLLLDGPRYRRLAIEAKRRHVSVASIIREAIDRLPATSDERRAAIAEILAAQTMPVPTDPGDLHRELDDAHDRQP